MDNFEAPGSQATPDKRLESWKEIAAYLRRDARTVQRWERLEGLPVHRHFHGRQGTVYAFESELRVWWQSRRARLDAPEPESQPAATVSAAAVDIEPAAEPIAPSSAPAAGSSDAPRFPASLRARLTVLALAIAGCVVLILLLRESPGALAGWFRLPHAAAGRPAGNRDAQALYLQGRYYWEKRSAPDITRAVDYFTQSIVHDPNYAPAYVGLADCYSLLREYGTMPDSEAFPRALAAAKKAVELDDTSSDAHTSLAFTSFYGAWDASTAEREFNRAIQLNPANVRAHHWHATFLMTLGRWQEALAEISRAQELDPRSAPILADKGLILFNAGRRDEALALLRQLEQDEPDFISGHRYLASIGLANGDYSTWLTESRLVARLVNNNEQLAQIRAQQAGFESGGAKGMLEVVRQQQEEGFQKGSLPAYSLAQVCAKLGEKQDAVEYLQMSYREHEADLLFLRSDPAFANLHDQPEYRDLVKRVYPNE